jgi:hypothetical protein
MQTDIRALQSQHRAQRPMSAGSHLVIGSSEFLIEEPPRGISQKKCQPKTNPFRNGRASEGNTEHLTILLDTVGHGKLPEDYQPAGPLLVKLSKSQETYRTHKLHNRTSSLMQG